MPTAHIDEAAINRRACEHFSDMINYIIDNRGRPTPDVANLNPAAQPRRLHEWSIRNTETGAWRSLSGAAGEGSDLISLIAHLADVDRQTSAAFLETFIERARINRRVGA